MEKQQGKTTRFKVALFVFFCCIVCFFLLVLLLLQEMIGSVECVLFQKSGEEGIKTKKKDDLGELRTIIFVWQTL